MVDITGKQPTNRMAIASGFVLFRNDEPIQLIKENSNKKGDVLGVARIAGIMAAKRCSDIIPLCHPIPISKVTVHLDLIGPGQPAPGAKSGRLVKHGGVSIMAQVHCFGSTGVEMEALTAVTGAALTIHDMCKAVDPDIITHNVKVLLKQGGKNGDWKSEDWTP